MAPQRTPVFAFPVSRVQLFGTVLRAGSNSLDIWWMSVEKLFRHAQNTAAAMHLVFVRYQVTVIWDLVPVGSCPVEWEGWDPCIHRYQAIIWYF